MSVIALIPAAGSGSRLEREKDDKPFLELGGKPVLVYVLSCFDRAGIVDDVKLIVKEKYIEKAKLLIAEFGIRKVTDVISGGDSRTRSVANGIDAIDAADEDIILIHDGARPFVAEDIISAAVESALLYGAAVAGIPCAATIKKVDEKGIIEDTPDRSPLWEAQTPQAFRYGIIKEAYRKFEGQEATDDSCFVERMGHKVRVVKGDGKNIKITVPADLVLAEAILASVRAAE